MFDLDRENKGKFSDLLRNIDKTLIIIVILLFFLGLFFSFSSTSSIAAEKLNTKNYYFFIKHLAFVLIALGFIFLNFPKAFFLCKDVVHPPVLIAPLRSVK